MNPAAKAEIISFSEKDLKFPAHFSNFQLIFLKLAFQFFPQKELNLGFPTTKKRVKRKIEDHFDKPRATCDITQF